MTDSVRLRWLLTESDVRAGAEAGALPLLSVSISWGVRRREASDMTTRAASDDLSNYKLCCAGDLVINRMRAFQGALGIASEDGVVSPDYAVLRVDPMVDKRWLNYFLTSEFTVATMASLVRGIGGTEAGNVRTPRLNISDLQSMTAPLVSSDEQSAIADYLDRETARIDTLVEEQRRLIEILGERRDAIVAEAATKGVRAGVAHVESGVEWIGAIPERWSVKALRRCGTLLTGSTPPTDDRDNFAEEANEYPWVRPQDLSSATTASAWLTPQGWSHLRPVPAGSVLVGCIAYSLGSVGYLPVPATTNQQITSVVPTEVDGRYLYYVLHTAKSELWAASQMNRVPILNNQRLGAMQIPVPPVDEQRLIAEYLDEQTAKIDRTKVEAERFIELARERRLALITAAVTGQIDVREMV